jgi:serine/threonine protein phosphatase PrpC
MSTKSFIPEMRKGTGPSVLVLLGGILIALQLVLPAVAFASPARAAAPNPPADQAFALAEVSVVRLVVSYSTTQPVGGQTFVPSAECTGLGVLVASWATTNPREENTWVLTDGDLVNKNGATCAGRTSAAQIATLQVYANTVYTSHPQGLLLSSQSFVPVMVRCSDTKTCSSGAVLFAFHTDQPQPYLDVAASTSSQTVPFGIELTKDGSLSAIPTRSNVNPTPQQTVQYLNQMRQFLTPTKESSSSTLPDATPVELGMPLVDRSGNLAGIQLNAKGVFSAAQITQFLAAQPELRSSPARPNDLNKQWRQGMKDYYAGHLSNARQELTAAKTATFTAPSLYLSSIAAKTSGSSGGQPATPPSSGGVNIFGMQVPVLVLLLLSVVGLVALMIILVLVSLRFGAARAKRREELKRFKADEAEAQRIAEMEVQRQQQLQQPKSTPVLNKASTLHTQSPATLPCPNCQQPVPVSAEYCPNCRYLLSPSASGLHLRARPPAAPAGDVPTIKNPPASPIPRPAAQAAPSMSDMPTMQFPPNGQPDAQAEITEKPYKVEQVTGRNLSLVVGTRTDPGIKRKHKPNEDSLFAMQGARTHSVQPEQFGLFVVADGMGGHANGQDASRLAIQTIINYMLPILSAGGEMNDDGFMKLLSDGVQQANQAVHQNNQERRADMGTTMTTALVVGSMAYIANVGDSRTYLYREPEGLSKITHDHSVVASLVDAGVIKPDDIYTHPKRNQIYRSLGEKPVVEVDTFKVRLQPGDKLLLCSDGLWDMVRDPEIQRVMRTPASDPSQTTSGLIQAALDGGGEDNISVIVVNATEATRRTGVAGVQLLAKPDTVSVPNI